MTSQNTVAQLEDQLWQAIADTRDAYPREAKDAPTDEVVAAVLPVVAAEMRRIADLFGEAQLDRRSLIALVRMRADELDPPATEED